MSGPLGTFLFISKFATEAGGVGGGVITHLFISISFVNAGGITGVGGDVILFGPLETFLLDPILVKLSRLAQDSVINNNRNTTTPSKPFIFWFLCPFVTY